MNGGDGGTRALVPPYRRIRAHRGRSGMGVPVHWRDEVRTAVRAHLNEFVDAQCRTDLGAAKVDVAGEILSGFVDGGKYVRSTFMYLGWLCGAGEDDSALRASASLELFHAFALMRTTSWTNRPCVAAGPPRM